MQRRRRVRCRNVQSSSRWRNAWHYPLSAASRAPVGGFSRDLLLAAAGELADSGGSHRGHVSIERRHEIAHELMHPRLH